MLDFRPKEHWIGVEAGIYLLSLEETLVSRETRKYSRLPIDNSNLQGKKKKVRVTESSSYQG